MSYENSSKYYSRKARETSQIILYIYSKIEQICSETNFDSLIEGCKELSKKPVCEGEKRIGINEFNEFLNHYEHTVNKGKLHHIYDIKEKDFFRYYAMYIDMKCSEKHKILCLIMTIYQIRCNLFHGDKNPYINRDLHLISEASMVMERLLNILIKDINTPYDSVLEQIHRYDPNKSKAKKNWSGANLIITKSMTQQTDFQRNHPGVKLIVNPNAKHIIWLIGIMKPYTDIDYLSRYDYYAAIGAAIEDYEKLNDGDDKVSAEYIKGLQHAILNSVTKYMKPLMLPANNAK